jgi:hypothetical protein
MMSSGALPPRARAILEVYIDEKFAGLYGHDKKMVRAFRAKLLSLQNKAPGFPPDLDGPSSFRGNIPSVRAS